MVDLALKTLTGVSFLWLTDFHEDKYYGTQSALRCVHSDVSWLGTNGCDSPEALVDSAINEAYRLLPESPFIVLSGDFMRHGDDNQTEKLGVENEVLMKIRDLFPNAVLLPSIGNNDLFTHWKMEVTTELPYNWAGSLHNRNEWLTRIAAAWGLSNNPPCQHAFDSFSYGGYYSCDIDKLNLSLIQLNSIPYGSEHWPNTRNMDDPFGQLAWLNDTLSSLKARKRKAFLTGHVGWGVSAYKDMPSSLWTEKYTLKFLDLIAKHDDVIQAQLFGHEHMNILRLPPKTYKVSSPLLITAAISPIFSNFPTIRVVHVKEEKLCITGFDDYHLNISDPTVKPTDWNKFGDMQSEYRLPAGECFSVDAARSEFQKMWYNNTQDWMDYLTYWAGGAGMLKNYYNNVIFCSMMWVTQNEFQQCISRQLPGTKKQKKTYLIILFIILCLVCLPIAIWWLLIKIWRIDIGFYRFLSSSSDVDYEIALN